MAAVFWKTHEINQHCTHNYYQEMTPPDVKLHQEQLKNCARTFNITPKKFQNS
jgi:hypothetical protein